MGQHLEGYSQNAKIVAVATGASSALFWVLGITTQQSATSSHNAAITSSYYSLSSSYTSYITPDYSLAYAFYAFAVALAAVCSIALFAVIISGVLRAYQADTEEAEGPDDDDDGEEYDEEEE